MAKYVVHQCLNPDCGLRLPIDTETHLGLYCPRCGEHLSSGGKKYQQFVCPKGETSSTRRLVVVLDNLRSAFNVGAIFRTADGVGVGKVNLCGITPTPLENPSISKTALGAEMDVPWEYHPDGCHLARDLIDKGYYLLGLECTPQATPLFSYKVDQEESKPMALVLGNEKAGIDPEILGLCDAILYLPMAGKKSSLNVAVAFGVAAYWLMGT